MDEKNKPTPLQIGDTVKVHQGFKDPDTKVKMGGWHGRITQLFPEKGTAMIAFDSQTLRNIPANYIKHCEVDGYSWRAYGYDLTDLTKVEPRDTQEQANAVSAAIEAQNIYAYLGEEGQEIRRIIQSVDPDGKRDHLDVWSEYLQDHLRFPFAAVVDEWQSRGPLRPGDKVRIHAIEDTDEMYGIIVKLRRGLKQFHFPLCNLAAADQTSPEYHLIDLYRTWFANK